MLKHGHCPKSGDTPEYRSWRAMMRRCYTKTDQKYPRYGAIGIQVCTPWHKFENFLADMGPRPPGRYTLDRFPNQDGNYEPGNCRWATDKQQSRNKKSTRFVVLDGQRRPLYEVIEERGLHAATVVSRVKRGWSPEDAIAGYQKIKRPPKLSRRNTSGATGVFKTRSGKFLAHISIERKTRQIGLFETFKEALAARLAYESQ